MGRNLDNYILKNYQKAIDYHEIQAYFQPVIRTSSYQLCSFEALPVRELLLKWIK